MNVLAVIPTYNERDNLPDLVRAVLSHRDCSVMVVDDGSPDGTGPLADALAEEFPGRVEVVHRTGPRGLGRSYVEGLKRALAEGRADLVCQMDADWSHDPKYLPALIDACGAYDVVIGSRYLRALRVLIPLCQQFSIASFQVRLSRRCALTLETR